MDKFKVVKNQHILQKNESLHGYLNYMDIKKSEQIWFNLI